MDETVVMGRFAGLYGVRGWLKVVSYTDPPHALCDYPAWLLRTNGDWHDAGLEAVKPHGKGLIAKLALAGDRDSAAAWIGAEIGVGRQDFAPPDPGEYYWSDLIGLRVITRLGRDLGEVTGLIETGVHDVLVARGGATETLVPFVIDRYVLEVDLPGRRIVVDWDWDADPAACESRS